jgi:hypothetical protein
MSSKIPFPFPYSSAIQECLAATMNFDAVLQAVKAASDEELARMADAGEVAELEKWLERAEGVKVRGYPI